MTPVKATQTHRQTDMAQITDTCLQLLVVNAHKNQDCLICDFNMHTFLGFWDVEILNADFHILFQGHIGSTMFQH